MNRFVLGFVAGVAATVAFLQQRRVDAAVRSAGGRVDELSSAAGNPVADPALDAGDGTPRRPPLEA
jgi:hypothetical protein